MKGRSIVFEALFLICASLLIFCSTVQAKGNEDAGGIGPQSTQAVGEKKVLMVAVRFPDAVPSIPIDVVRKKITAGLGSYVKEQSYGRASIKADFVGYVTLPGALADYVISPYNFRVDKGRIRRFIEDTMSAIEKKIDLAAYDHMLIVPAVNTTPGKGYGMICYCANPGMLSGVTKRYVPRYETLRSAGGREFTGGIFVGAENAALGMFAHDYFHALGGIHDSKRLVPCLYDFDRQSDASAGLPSFERHATYMGPWDIMSQHYVTKGEPPQGLSSFTKIRLGWIGKRQVHIVNPGDTSYVMLAPLSKGGEFLVVKIPLGDGTYYLIENRQRIGYDRVLPDSGILVLKVNPRADEGYGTVEVKGSSGPRNLANAPYRLELDGRNVFTDAVSSGSTQRSGIAVVSLWKEKEDVGVLVTTPQRSEAAIKAARAIQAIVSIDASDIKRDNLLAGAIAAFKEGNFEKSYAIAVRYRQ